MKQSFIFFYLCFGGVVGRRWVVRGIDLGKGDVDAAAPFMKTTLYTPLSQPFLLYHRISPLLFPSWISEINYDIYVSIIHTILLLLPLPFSVVFFQTSIIGAFIFMEKHVIWFFRKRKSILPKYPPRYSNFSISFLHFWEKI